jgi:DNA-binding CsgD family transcriptional regulator
MSEYIATIKIGPRDILHYGMPRRSGRYPWGSGENPHQHEAWFGSYLELKSKGMSETDIARGLGMSTTELRAKKSIAKAEQRAAMVSEAVRLKDSGMSNMEIGRQMGINESSVRNLLNPTLQERADKTRVVADVLKKNVDEKGFIDIGPGVEYDLGVRPTRMKTAVAMLKEEGYTVHKIYVDQVGTGNGNKTTLTVLAPPGTEYKEVFKHKEDIKTITDYIQDDGKTVQNLYPPESISSDRIFIRYGDEGGKQKDGVIELRRGVEDISLGNSDYAQVRVAVDGKNYMKGMAMYSDDIPDGYDVVYNTNKHTGTPKEKVFKELKDDPDNPFGATIKAGGQRFYTDENGEKHLSVINKINEEGDWKEWSKNIASQVLSKQPVALAKKQLNLSYADKVDEFEEIKNLTNPAVKKVLLESFADDCDASAVHLKAAAFPRQASHVILPIPDMKENEIYAPNYKNGESVVLIRYPHGGIFEIPELTVNNKQKTANSLIHNAPDAVGINSKVAERLSGADFDGDTVLVIPTSTTKIKTSSPLKGLEEFDPKEEYPGYEGMKKMTSQNKQTEMGKVTNLITDMTLKGANEDEICRAVKHSMVVIDSEKHGLNYQKSYIDNGIAELKAKYQGSEKAGASTLISRAKSKQMVPVRKEARTPDPETGEKRYIETGETYTKTTKNRKGEVVEKTITRLQESTKMAEAKDAFELSSGTPMETVYANYANKMKALGNEARKEMMNTPSVHYSPSAKAAYAEEVDSLQNKLTIAKKNAPRERQAQLIANVTIENKKKDNPDMSKEDLKKIKSQALAAARSRTGASKKKVDITDKEWAAIQSGALSQTTVMEILRNSDLDKVKKLATPKSNGALSQSKVNRIKAMSASGYSTAEIAEAVGVSTSAVTKTVAA